MSVLSSGGPAGAGPGWRRLAVHSGGTVSCLSSARAAGGTLTIFAATPVGVFRSADDGQSWRPAGQIGGLPFVTGVAASPSFATDRTVFAATWNGLFRSTDAGDSWQPVLAGGTILAVAVSPGFATDRTVLVGTVEDGILRSDDGGGRWVGANAGLLDFTVQALVLAPTFADAGTAFAGTPSGLFRSRNGGQSWQEIDLDLDDDLDGTSVQALALGPGFPGDPLIAVGTETAGLLLSGDGGATWSSVPPLAGRSVGAVAIHAWGTGTVAIVAGTERTLMLSEDRGQSWHQIGDVPAPVLTLAAASTETDGGPPTETLVGLARSGVVRFSGADRRLRPSGTGLHAIPLSLLAVSPDIAQDGTLYAASADGTVLVSRDRGQTLEPVAFDPEGDSVTGLVVSPGYRTDRALWVSTPDRLSRSRDAARTWEPLPIPRATGDVEALEALPDAPPARLLAAIQDLAGQVTLFLARGAELGRSDDAGESWHWLSPPDRGAEVVALVGQPQAPGGLVLFALTRAAPGPDGARHQTLWRSPDGGETWERWLEGAANAAPVMVGWDGPASGPKLLVGTGRSVYAPRADARERRGGVVRPLWRQTEVSPEVTRVVGLATPAGPAAGRTIFAGTDAGVFVSRDGGRSFVPWSDGLEPPSVLALAVAPDYATSGEVLALGPGGAVWHRTDR